MVYTNILDHFSNDNFERKTQKTVFWGKFGVFAQNGTIMNFFKN